MDFFEVIGKRRSIRKFQNKPVEPEKVTQILTAALRAPSSRGFNPCEFIVVTDPNIIRQLAEAKQHGSSFLAGAPLAVVICADAAKSDVWVEDTAIATTFISLAAEALGLGNCWIQIRERMYGESKTSDDYVRELLQIPTNLKIDSIVAIGYPDERKEGHSQEGLQYGKIHKNRYGQSKDLTSG